jgi:glutathione S-transferase
MTSTTPVLYVFAISHYCEKARWALEYLGVEHQLRHVAPGEHGQIAKRLGAARSSVPYLSVGARVIQGSADIVDWADASASAERPRLTPAGNRDHAACVQIEQRIDDIAGVHVRRFYYSEAIVDCPETVRPIFTRDLPFTKKLLVTAAWGKIRKLMIAGMDLGATQGQESRRIVAGELDWIDELLADGRPYLVGNQFSRADIAVASLLSPLVIPPQHPVYANLELPPGIAACVAEWNSRPSIQWVRDIYARHRQS